MPRRKKPAIELTRDELARRVFPKKVVQEAKKIAQKRTENHLDKSISARLICVKCIIPDTTSHL